MKITLNEKLFEAKEKKDKNTEKKSKSPSDKKANGVSKPKEEDDDSDIELPDESVEEKAPVQKDSRSDYMKKLMLFFKKTGFFAA